LIGVFIVAAVFPSLAAEFGYALDETILGTGSGWVVLGTVGAALAVMTAAVLWLQYGRGKTGLARTVFGIAVLLPLVGIVLVSAKNVIAVQQAVAPGPPPEDFALALSGGCFFAESIDPSAADAADAGAPHSRLMGTGLWDQDQLARAGRKPVAYATAFSTEGVPKGWRLMVAHAQATYTDEHGNVLERPLPSRAPAASVVTIDGETSSVHYWLLPRMAAEWLAQEPSTHLTIDYSLSLLAPRNVELAVDRGWQSLPYVGYCSAEYDAAAATVNIDCFKRGAQPARIAAKFTGALGSADSFLPDYAPVWFAPLTGQRYRIALKVPSGVDRSTVTLTAYEARAHFERRVEARGVLGGPTAECPLPPLVPPAATELQSIWRDSSPHRVTFVGVDEGVRLEVLDWGGSGRPVVYLTGLGDSAHAFDNIGPKLAERYRVYAISRRGHGASTVAEAGYTVPRLTDDVVRVLDALQLQSPVVVGSSIAGEELSELGAKHSSRVAGLVYLDAAADRTPEIPQEFRAAERLVARLGGPTPPASAHELASYAGLLEYMDRLGASHYSEGAILSMFEFGPDGRVAGRRIDPRVPAAIMDAVQKPDYAAIRVPALAIYAMPRDAGDMWRPWYHRTDLGLARSVEADYELTVRARRAAEHAFAEGVAGGRVVELPGAKHHVLLSNEADVIAELDAFIAQLPAH
jgi:pimeloyl-ACP methyl ester carboxylesterase